MLLLNSSENMVCRCCCRTSQNHIDFVQPLETVKIHVLCNKNTSGMFQPAMKAFFLLQTRNVLCTGARCTTIEYALKADKCFTQLLY